MKGVILHKREGRSPTGVVTSDRFSAYAYLRPDLHAMIDRDDTSSAIGEDLLMDVAIRFDGWSKVRAGTRSRRAFATRTV